MNVKEIPSIEGYYVSVNGIVSNSNGEPIPRITDRKLRWCVYLNNKKYIISNLILTAFENGELEFASDKYSAHIDGDKLNIKLENLVWINATWQNKLKTMVRGKFPPYISYEKDNEVIHFNHLKDAAEYFSVDMKTCFNMIKEESVINDGVLRYININKLKIKNKVYKPDNYNVRKNKQKINKRIIIFNLLTNECLSYDSITSAAKELKVARDTISNNMSTSSELILYKNSIILECNNVDSVLSLLKEKITATAKEKVIISYNTINKNINRYDTLDMLSIDFKFGNINRSKLTKSLNELGFWISRNNVFIYEPMDASVDIYDYIFSLFVAHFKK